MTAIHLFCNRHAISDVYRLGRCTTQVGSWLPNCETAHPSVSSVEHSPLGCPEMSVNKYQPTPQNQGRPKTCGRPGQI